MEIISWKVSSRGPSLRALLETTSTSRSNFSSFAWIIFPFAKNVKWRNANVNALVFCPSSLRFSLHFVEAISWDTNYVAQPLRGPVPDRCGKRQRHIEKELRPSTTSQRGTDEQWKAATRAASDRPSHPPKGWPYAPSLQLKAEPERGLLLAVLLLPADEVFPYPFGFMPQYRFLQPSDPFGWRHRIPFRGGIARVSP